MSAGAEGAPRESISGVLGVGFGLALLGWCALALWRVGPDPLDARAVLDADFELGTLPFGLELGEALRFASGETIVVLADASDFELPLEQELAGEDPAREEDSPEEGAPADGEPKEPPKVDWSKVVEGEAGTPPARVYLVRYSASGARSALARQFRDLEWRELADIEPQGGRAVVDGGRVRWGEYAADYVRERRFLPGLRFQDSVRVNLTLPERYWIAYAYWPPGLPGSKEPVETVLAALRARELEESASVSD